MAEKRTKYGNHVANLHDTSRGWRAAAYSLTVIAVILAMLTWHISNHSRVILVPARFAHDAKGQVQVTRNAEYLGMLARSDVDSLLDWTPSTVGTQFGAFLARCSPGLYARLNPQMIADAKTYASYNLAEAFYITRIKFSPPGTVIVSGWLDRYSGDKRVMHALLNYTMQYGSAFTLTKVEVSKKNG